MKMKMVYAGNTFTEMEIKAKPLVEIDEGLKNRFGKGRMNFNVKPGATLPFMIVLEDLQKILASSQWRRSVQRQAHSISLGLG